MSTYQLSIPGIRTDAQLSAVRWELFVCREIVDVRRSDAFEGVTISSSDPHPDLDLERWVHVLGEAGYEVEAVASAASESKAAA